MKSIYNNLLFNTFGKIKNELPSFVYKSTIRLIPLYVISSFFELLGLAIIIPVINLLIESSNITESEFFSSLYNYFKFENNVSFVLFLLSIIGIIFIFKNALLYLILKHQTNVGFSLASKLATNKYNSYLKKPYIFFSENNTAILLRNITQLPVDLIVYNIFPFIGLLNEFFIILIIIITMTWYSPLLFIATIVFVIPFVFLFNKFYKGKLKQISAIRDLESSNMYKFGLQSLDGYREITVFDKLNYFRPLFQKSMNAYTNVSAAGYLLNVFSPKIVETVALICLINIFLFGFIFGKNIQLLTQFMVVFAIAAYRIIPSINKIILFSNYIKTCSYTFSYFSKEDEENPVPLKEKKIHDTVNKLSFAEKIEIKNLSFRYAGKEPYILNNLNLTVNKGSTIGIVGTSGSGKSTLLNILLRLYEEEEGGIYVDGVKIRSVNREQWYSLVSYVPQQMTLFEGTIKENIAFGIESDKIDEELLQSVISRSQLKNYVYSLPKGFNTPIGEKGIKISGGQKQRIAIARALYHGGQILIFDEATSSLDSETEEMLTDSIHSISHQDLTIIIVSHRHQTLKYCDLIYKLEQGIISNPHTYHQLFQNITVNG